MNRWFRGVLYLFQNTKPFLAWRTWASDTSCTIKSLTIVARLSSWLKMPRTRQQGFFSVPWTTDEKSKKTPITTKLN